jgi:anti-anti-sigma regulatory factor
MASDEQGVSTTVLSGPATIYESSEVRETLLAAFSEGKDLRIDLETSGPWDLAGLQLLVSAVASGLRDGRSVRFVGVPRVCAEVAERSGLTEWLHGVSDSFL